MIPGSYAAGGGSHLGPHEILTALGAGGMGDVYNARNTRLGRTVAIKVLCAQMSNRPDLRERFESEARAVKSISPGSCCKPRSTAWKKRSRPISDASRARPRGQG